MRSQKERVLQLLRERGTDGLSAREAIYDLRITRLAAIIFDLRQEGYVVESETKKGQTARYWLAAPSRAHAANVRHCGNCGHLFRRHVAGMKCMDYVGGGMFVEPCPCYQFEEARHG